MATQAQPRDAMQFINEQDAETLERFIERLEFRGKDPMFVAYRDAYFELIDLGPGSKVLDLGCGTGVVTRAIGERFGAAVTGVDQSPVLLAVAERGGQGRFLLGDAHALDLPDASFDAVVAHTLISHVRDPRGVIAEAARIVRPGGTIAVSAP